MNKNNESSKRILLIVLLLLVVVLLVLLIFKLALDKPDNQNNQATATVSATDDQKPTGTPDVTPTAIATATAAPTPTVTPTAAPTPTYTPTPTPTIVPGPTPTPTPENIYATGISATEGTLMDYSFLANVSTDYFHDINIKDRYSSGKNAGKLCGSWWSGTEIKDGSGKITDVVRKAQTEALLEQYEARYINRNAGKTVYLTFDCGYENGNTAKILDTLQEKNVKAIFFITAQFMNETGASALVNRMVNEGHLIGNHTWNHPNMCLSSNDTFVNELTKTQTKLNEMLGYEYTMTYYRPPEGASSERDLALAKKLGYRTVFWSFAYGDYNPDNQMDPEKALNNYLKAKLHSGAVYLLHAVSSTNATILGDFIDYAESEGYTFERIDNWV